MTAFIDAQDQYSSIHALALVDSRNTGERRTRVRWIWARSLGGSGRRTRGNVSCLGRAGGGRGGGRGANGRIKPNGLVNERKTPPPPLPNILFSKSPTPTTHESVRKGKGKVVEAGGDVEMLDGDEDARPPGEVDSAQMYVFSLYSIYSLSFFLFLRFCHMNIELIAYIFSNSSGITHHHL